MLFGAMLFTACINWDFIARRSGDLNALILAALLQIVGILLPVLVPGLWSAMLGSLLFGGTFIGMVSLVLSMAGRYYPGMPAKMMGKMTLSYGVAQIIGPAVTGMIGAQFGSYNAGLYVAAAVMALGAGLLLALIPPADTMASIPLPVALSVTLPVSIPVAGTFGPISALGA